MATVNELGLAIIAAGAGWTVSTLIQPFAARLLENEPNRGTSLPPSTLGGITALLFAAITWRHGLQPLAAVWCAFAATLVACAAIDFKHRIIPDELSLGGCLAALLLVPCAVTLSNGPFTETLACSVTGSLVGAGVFWFAGFVHARVSVAVGRTFKHWPERGAHPPRPNHLDYWTWFPGVGLGDIKLMGLVGAVVGPMGVLESIIASSLAGIALGGIACMGRRRWEEPFGFAPAIACGALAIVLIPGHLLGA